MKRLTPRRLGVALGATAAASLAAIAVALEMGPLPAGILRGGDTALALSVRGPRVLAGALVGAALASSGVAFQALLRNPLADPFILGVSGGAAVGAVGAMTIGAGGGAAFAATPLFAFAGALGATLLVWGLARRRTGTETERLLLTGVVVNAFLSALILLFSYLAPPGARLRILQWMTGNLDAAGSGAAELALLGAILAAAFAIFFALARDLDLLSLGDRAAAHLGVNVPRARALLFFAGSLATGAAVAAGGLVGFVGIVVPHALRLLVGPDHRVLVPAAFLAGGGFLALADGVARTALLPDELPVGVLTALSGGPFFLFLLLRRPRLSARAAGPQPAGEEPIALAPPPAAASASATATATAAASASATATVSASATATAAAADLAATALVAREIELAYGGRPVLRGVDLEVRPGEMLALFGPNGAGKSTLLRVLAGDLSPVRGAVTIGGRPLRALGRREIARLLGVVPQEPLAPLPYTAGEIVLMGRAPRVARFRMEGEADARAALRALAALGAAALCDRPVGELSGGERQRVAIARAIAQETPVLLLDEPTAFLDVRHQVEAFRLLRALARERGRAVLVASHEVNLAAQYADRVALLGPDGRLRAIGPPEEALRADLLADVFQAPAELARHARTGRPYLVFGGD